MDSVEISVGFTKIAEQHLGKLAKAEQKKVADYLKRVVQSGELAAGTLTGVGGLIFKKVLGDIRILFTYDKRQRALVVRMILWRRENTYDDVARIQVEVESEKQVRQQQKKLQRKKTRR